MARLRPVDFEDRLTLVEHLDELRTRIVISVAAFAVAFAVCFWQNDRILDIEPEFLNPGEEHDHSHDHGHDHGHDHHHHDHGGLKHYHDEDMQSFSIKTDTPLSPDKFFPWIQKVVAEDGPSILRCKGIVAFPNEPKRFVFQGVHMILDGDLQRDWKAGEERQSRLVFIGRDLDGEMIRAGALACAA